LSALAALTDKMKNVSDVLDIEASSDGILTLSAEQSMVRDNTQLACRAEGMAGSRIRRAKHEELKAHATVVLCFVRCFAVVAYVR
jgi:hypothetical protein